MLIGKGFNSTCEKILIAAGEQADYKPGRNVSVLRIADQLNLDRVVIRNSFEHLIELQFINVESIGGPMLYGHISVTKKGILKLRSIQDQSGSFD